MQTVSNSERDPTRNIQNIRACTLQTVVHDTTHQPNRSEASADFADSNLYLGASHTPGRQSALHFGVADMLGPILREMLQLLLCTLT